ncbi:class I SAM-dependent methyltransferase [Nonomuraea cypriaca]|uniref:class I SAM-dependent methyltransferase n=1 Tax=Nonomuraea cypriaca TaxID=1187855 RepID=UPI001A9C442F|nr:class I SAM-dependent methyltransferase [Nonomuraea cypriaca]
MCDLFESDAPEAHNNAETTRSYSTLNRRQFEQNYLNVHDTLPEIVQGPTSITLDHAKGDTCRFVHVDASHLYTHVKDDVLAARTTLKDDGIVAFDDYRSEHTPGVALAVWEAVAGLGLAPVCISTQKLYATWGDPVPVQRRLLEWLKSRTDLWHTTDVLGDRDLVRVNQRRKPKPVSPGNDLDISDPADNGRRSRDGRPFRWISVFVRLAFRGRAAVDRLGVGGRGRARVGAEALDQVRGGRAGVVRTGRGLREGGGRGRRRRAGGQGRAGGQRLPVRGSEPGPGHRGAVELEVDAHGCSLPR